MMSSLNILWWFYLVVLVSAIKKKLSLRSVVPGFEEDEVPHKNDLEKYITSLEKVVNFYAKYTNEIDISTVFGFFLIRVNIKSALKNKPKNIPQKDVNRLMSIMQKSKKISDYIKMMAAQPQQTPEFKRLRNKANLYSDDNFWASHMNNPDKKKIKPAPDLDYQDLVSRFSSYSEYVKRINKVKKILPSYTTTDECLIELANNHVNNGRFLPKCKLSQSCTEAVKNGSNEGYGVMNRLLILMLARFGKHCGVLNEKEDKKIADNLCSRCYREATFISLYNFDPVMLMIDQITLCSLNGNLEFLHAPWINYIMALQTPYGCFSDEIIRDYQTPLPKFIPSSRWSMDRGNQERQQVTECYVPASSGAAAILSAAIKYVLEYTYEI